MIFLLNMIELNFVNNCIAITEDFAKVISNYQLNKSIQLLPYRKQLVHLQHKWTSQGQPVVTPQNPCRYFPNNDYNSKIVFENEFLGRKETSHWLWSVITVTLTTPILRQHSVNTSSKLYIRPTLVCNKLADHSDVVAASLVGAAPITSSLST